MKHSFLLISFALTSAMLFDSVIAIDPSHSRKNHAGHWRFAMRHQHDLQPRNDSAGSAVSPCAGPSCVAVYPPASNLPCTSVNDTTIRAGINNQKWTLLCDVDFFAQDIFPFILAGSFEECLKQCDNYNQANHDDKCQGFVFAPDRAHMDNDCYLKSSTNSAISPSTIHLVGATLISEPASSTSSTVAQSTGSVTPSNKQPDDGDDGEQLSFGNQVKLLGTSTNNPIKQYVSHPPALPVKLATKLLQPGINLDLVTKYSLAGDTGSWTQSSTLYSYELANLTITPRLSRDGGKGGMINGTHVFYFCDTSTFGEVEGPIGYMNGFVSSSAAIDTSRKALDGNALELDAPIGQWQDDVGRLRGWIPMTTGEEAFNIAVSGQGYRYAVWPESSFISLNESHSLIYAPVVYVEVDMQTQSADFTSLGNTLVAVSIDSAYGPHADRLVNQLFTENEVEWGSLGGLRAWTESGLGSNDGEVYLFGQVDNGILVARVGATDITDRSAYTYWDGSNWSSTMPDKSSTAYVVEQAVMDCDIFYAPLHKTFFMIYLTPYADNTFYYRKLKADHDVIPPYIEGGDADYVENIVHQPWSDPMVLYQPPVPASGYIYAGGVHLGYFGDDDIANGGRKLLITWTEHTEKDPNDPSSGYAHKSIVVE